jgi:DDB1- and CUL4-associated factor 13
VKGIAVAPTGKSAVSCSADCTVKVWKIPTAPLEHGVVQEDVRPMSELVGQHAFLGVDYHYQDDRFATCGHAVDIWDAEHSDPVQTLRWDSESVYSVRFNPVRAHPLSPLFAGAAGPLALAVLALTYPAGPAHLGHIH